MRDVHHPPSFQVLTKRTVPWGGRATMPARHESPAFSSAAEKRERSGMSYRYAQSSTEAWQIGYVVMAMLCMQPVGGSKGMQAWYTETGTQAPRHKPGSRAGETQHIQRRAGRHGTPALSQQSFSRRERGME